MKWKQSRETRRKITKYFRRMNKNIENDPLWKGRFYANVTSYSYFPYEDGSGILMKATVTFHDKKTGKEYTHYYDNYDYHHGYWDMNSFIVEYVDAWNEIPPPRI